MCDEKLTVFGVEDIQQLLNEVKVSDVFGVGAGISLWLHDEELILEFPV